MSHMVEKPGDDRGVLGGRLAESEVGWHPLRYQRRPPAVSAAHDIRRGTLLVRRLAVVEGVPSRRSRYPLTRP